MATTAPYKQYNRQQRRAVLETDYSKGMMSSNSLVDEGYVKSLVNFTFDKESGSLIPRPALKPYQLIMPDMSVESQTSEDSDWYADGVSIKDVKECVENGVTYYQIIVGLAKEDNRGYLAIVTTPKTDSLSEVRLSEDYTYGMRYGSGAVTVVDEDALYYSAQVPQIHDIILTEDRAKRMEFPVGSFAYGNSYYFFIVYEVEEGGETVTKKSMCRTIFDDSVRPPRYTYEVIEPKTLSVSEAVTYGYNMLLGQAAYTFINKHTAPIIQFEGILPYEVGSNHSKLLMTPKKNQPIDLVCYYDVEDNAVYDIVWETRETTSSDWTELKRDSSVIFDSQTELTFDNFRAQDKEIMVRVTAIDPDTDDVVKAMVVGFDFTASNYGAANTLEQKEYDLSTATGMESWNGRIVLWGLPVDPTILFISDYNEPAYFPYPNNIVVFDEPIIYAVEFMDSLCVFTTNKLYQVTLAEEGNSWKSTVLQSHLSINAWDKHLIQTVRNMLYFKSGNYYYMMVPKAQSQTGELTLAPITNPITSFFDNFSVNVEQILSETYDYGDMYELLSYYNFLDYEDIHNLYLYQFDNSDALLHFDVIYNTVDRTWRIWVYESAQILYPFRHNATELGLLATTSVITAKMLKQSMDHSARIIQIFSWDKMSMRGCYIPQGTELYYDSDQDAAQSDGETLVLPPAIATAEDDGTVVIDNPYADASGNMVYIIGIDGYYSGFSVGNISDTIRDVYNNSETYFTFRNYQFLDTGYRQDELQAMKRYREIQLLVDNLDESELQFGMEYMLDGVPNKIYYKYDVTQVIDEFNPEYGIVYIDSTPYLEADLSNLDRTNQWCIDQGLFPEVDFWKVRIAVSGKGTAPRLKLKSRNEKRFGILSINWISRIMNMR